MKDYKTDQVVKTEGGTATLTTGNSEIDILIDGNQSYKGSCSALKGKKVVHELSTGKFITSG